MLLVVVGALADTDVHFHVTDGTNDLQGATIKIFDNTGTQVGSDLTTDATGAVVGTVGNDGTYTYTVTMTGYADATGTFSASNGTVTVNGNTVSTIEVAMIGQTDVPFHVTDGTNDLQGATIQVFDNSGSQVGSDLTTDASGAASLSKLADGVYTYKVTMTGYAGTEGGFTTKAGTITVSGNTVTSIDVTLNKLYNITFNVNLNNLEGFDPSAKDVYISGGPFYVGGETVSWPQPGTNSAMKMSDPDGDKVYTITLQAVSGKVEFKFFLVDAGSTSGDWSQGEWQGTNNRSFTVSGDANNSYRWGLIAYNYLQDFENTGLSNKDSLVIPKWQNAAAVGTRAFQLRTYNSNSYAQAGSYGSTDSNSIYLITPGLILDYNAVLSFSTQFGYWNGDPATILIAKKLDNSNLDDISWTKLQFTVPSGNQNTSGYGGWFNSQNYDLSQYMGDTVYIAFRYTGKDGELTTTWQIDNISVTNIDDSVAAVIPAPAAINEQTAKINTFNIYPNPATDNIYIPTRSNVTIFSATGRVVLKAQNVRTIDVSNLPSGMYNVMAENKKGVSYSKFIKR